VVDSVEPLLAAQIVWFDSFTTNVDRTARNTNLLMWHKKLWLIDHGAALYLHHSWERYQEHAARPFTQIKDHVLLPFAGPLTEADASLRGKLSAETLQACVDLIPDEWLAGNSHFATTHENRRAYFDYLMGRLAASAIFVAEAERARENLI